VYKRILFVGSADGCSILIYLFSSMNDYYFWISCFKLLTLLHCLSLMHVNLQMLVSNVSKNCERDLQCFATYFYTFRRDLYQLLVYLCLSLASDVDQRLLLKHVLVLG